MSCLTDIATGSTHQDQCIGLFMADAMTKCIAEIREVEAEAAQTGSQPKLSWNQISKKYGLSPSTVSKWMMGKVIGMGPQVGGARREESFKQVSFSFHFTADEDILTSTIKRFQLSGFPLTIGRVCQLAFQYASVNGITGFSNERQMAGCKCQSGFLKCHRDISLKKARNLSIARAMGANPMVISQWYSLLKEVMDTVDITSPEQIWSGDETGIQNVPKEIKVMGYRKTHTFQ